MTFGIFVTRRKYLAKHNALLEEMNRNRDLVAKLAHAMTDGSRLRSELTQARRKLREAGITDNGEQND